VECVAGQLAFTNSRQKLGINIEQIPDGNYTLAVRPHHLSRERAGLDDIEVKGSVSVTELTGSETFVHFSMEDNPWVALLHDVQNFSVASTVVFYVELQHLFWFDSDDALVEWQSTIKS
jgi:glycerol transport system ATP-binding protein